MGKPETRLTKGIVEALGEDFPQSFFFKVLGGAFSLAGVPDLVGCIGGRFIALEVKTDTGKPSKIQLHIIECIQNAGGIAGVVRSYNDVLDLLYSYQIRPSRNKK